MAIINQNKLFDAIKYYVDTKINARSNGDSIDEGGNGNSGSGDGGNGGSGGGSGDCEGSCSNNIPVVGSLPLNNADGDLVIFNGVLYYWDGTKWVSTKTQENLEGKRYYTNYVYSLSDTTPDVTIGGSDPNEPDLTPGTDWKDEIVDLNVDISTHTIYMAIIVCVFEDSVWRIDNVGTPVIFNNADGFEGPSSFVDFVYSVGTTAPDIVVSGIEDTPDITYSNDWKDNASDLNVDLSKIQVYVAKVVCKRVNGTWSIDRIGTPEKWNGIDGANGADGSIYSIEYAYSISDVVPVLTVSGDNPDAPEVTYLNDWKDEISQVIDPDTNEAVDLSSKVIYQSIVKCMFKDGVWSIISESTPVQFNHLDGKEGDSSYIDFVYTDSIHKNSDVDITVSGNGDIPDITYNGHWKNNANDLGLDLSTEQAYVSKVICKKVDGTWTLDSWGAGTKWNGIDGLVGPQGPEGPQGPQGPAGDGSSGSGGVDQTVFLNETPENPDEGDVVIDLVDGSVNTFTDGAWIEDQYTPTASGLAVVLTGDSFPESAEEGQLFFNTSDETMYILLNGIWEDYFSSSVTPTASGISKIQFSAGLPDDGNSGDMIYNTLDDKIYIYIDGQWQDYFSQITPNASANASIEFVDGLPSSGEEGDIVYNNADEKMYVYINGQWEDYFNQVASTANSVSGIEVVSVLPASGVEGQTVYNNVDKKLYQYISGAWTQVVEPTNAAATVADGSLNTAAFASGFSIIEIVDALPGSDNYVGRMAMLKSDNKLYRYTSSGWKATYSASDMVGQITSTNIADNSITTSKITANSISANKLQVGSVTANAIASNSISTAKLQAGAVTASQIAANAITASKINSNSITSSKIAANAIDASKIVAGTISGDKIKANAITSGHITAGAVTASEIASYAITSNKIAANSIDASKIQAGSITANELSADAITAGTIGANSITASMIQAGAVGASEISAGAITSNKLAANSVTAGAISAGAVRSEEISSNAITADKIATGSVTSSKIRAGDITADKISAGHIGTAISSSGNKIVTAKEVFASTISYYNSTYITKIAYHNYSSTPVKVLVTANGRTGYVDNETPLSGSSSFGIFKNDTLIADYGWTPAWQDAKALSTSAEVPAGQLVYFAVRCVKDLNLGSTYTLGCYMRLSIIGIAEGA